MLYSIIDIETTGGNAKQGKIIEIAIFVYDGKSIVDSFCTLVNPETTLSPYIVQLTGITDEMLTDAPTFDKIAKRIIEITTQTVIVAHNIQFDYSYLREELRRCDKKFERKKLCTQKLARKIYPEMTAYGLGKLCEELDIPIERQHRAIDDAKATTYLFDKMMQLEEHRHYIDASLNKEEFDHWPPNLDIQIVQALPENAGLYYFLNEKKEVIYIGRSNDIQDRIYQHFSEFPSSQWRKQMFQEVVNVKSELTGSELLSMILEIYEIRKFNPIYSQSRKGNYFPWGVIKYKDQKGYIRFNVKRVKQRNLALSYHRSESSAKDYLSRAAEQYELVPYLCNLTNKANRNTLPDVEAYNKKALDALNFFEYEHNQFLILSEGRYPSEYAVILIKNERFFGYDYFEKEMLEHPSDVAKLIKPMMPSFSVDLVIKSYLRNGHLIEIMPVSHLSPVS